jgi:hypothetical protein
MLEMTYLVTGNYAYATLEVQPSASNPLCRRCCQLMYTATMGKRRCRSLFGTMVTRVIC